MLARPTRARLLAILIPIAALAAPAITTAAPLVDSVSFAVFACPASIQTPADLANAGGPEAVCAVAGRPGDFPTLPAGFSYTIEPIELDLQASLATPGGTLTNAEANAGSTCSTVTMLCRAYQAYAWFGVTPGKFTLTLDTIPTGYEFGWADVLINNKAGRATIDAATASVSVRAHPGISSVFVRFITIVP